VSDATIYNWLKQDKVDRGEIAGLSTDEALDLAAANAGSSSWKPSWPSHARSMRSSSKATCPPKRLFPVIELLTGQGNQRAPRLPRARRLGVRLLRLEDRPDPTRTLRRIWLAGEIVVGHNTVGKIMGELGIKGLPTRRLPKGARMAQVTSLDLVAASSGATAPISSG